MSVCQDADGDISHARPPRSKLSAPHAHAPRGPRSRLRWPPPDATTVQARGPHPSPWRPRAGVPLGLSEGLEKKAFWTGSPEAGSTPRLEQADVLG